MKNIPFARPCIDRKEIKAVSKALKSGWLTTGINSQKLEIAFLQKLNSKNTIAVNSATSGLHLAYEAFGVTSESTIITSTYTFTATAEAARYLGAEIIFTDTDENFNMSPEHLERILEEYNKKNKIKKIKAIVPVHIAGRCCNMKEILRIAAKYQIPVIEDAAHAFPAKAEGQYLGTLGNAGVFSFYATKTLTTGEGGLITTSDSKAASRMKTMRLHGIDRDVWNRYSTPGAGWEYDIVAPGYKYNMADLNASIGLIQLKKAEKMYERRKEIAQIYSQELSSIKEIKTPADSDAHSWHLYILQLNNNNLRNKLVEYLNNKGIGTSVHYKPLHMMSYYKDRYDLKALDFPKATEQFLSALSLPIYPGLTNRQVKYIAKEIRNFFQQES